MKSEARDIRGADPDLVVGRLEAQLNAQSFRELRLASVQVLAAASLPLWLQACWPQLPDLLLWLALVTEGFCFALAISYTMLAQRSDKHSPGLSPATIHSPGRASHGLPSGLWHALAALSLLPTASYVLHRPFAAWLLPRPSGLQALTALGAFSILTLLIRFFSTSTTMNR